jgi:hypothetical protein
MQMLIGTAFPDMNCGSDYWHGIITHRTDLIHGQGQEGWSCTQVSVSGFTRESAWLMSMPLTLERQGLLVMMESQIATAPCGNLD